jgi:hypothetical protein
MRHVARRVHLRPVRHAPPPGLAEWEVGLAAAARLRGQFPAFWRDHVARRRATADALLGVGAALMTLAAETVELSDYGMDFYAELIASSPPWALDHPPLRLSTGADPWQVLEEFLIRPHLMVYGLDLHVEDQDEIPPLAIALTRITGHDLVGDEVLAAALGVEGEDDERWAFFEAVALQLPRVDCARDGLQALCAFLVGTTCQGIDLGETLAYAHQITPNPFANLGYFELDDMRAYGAWEALTDGPPDFPAIADQQQDAQRLARAYQVLEDHCLADPDLLVDAIADAIARAAAQLGLPVRWPHEEEDDDAPYEDDHAAAGAPAGPDEAPALAAAPAAAGPLRGGAAVPAA